MALPRSRCDHTFLQQGTARFALVPQSRLAPVRVAPTPRVEDQRKFRATRHHHRIIASGIETTGPTMHVARRTLAVLLSSSFFGLPSTIIAQNAPKPHFDLTIANIMRGPELYGREPQDIRWSPDGQWIYFQWLPAG